jgi:cation diffusion facilitator CzcD-associated flavoprotein CzcO
MTAPARSNAGDQQDQQDQQVRVAVIGTGFAGIGAGIRLSQIGIDDYVLLERADAVGGTWRDNTYPGCGCDVPSHLYSFSFAPNPRWPRSFSRQPDIRQYLEDVTDRYGLRPHIRFNAEVLEAVWSDGERRWTIRTTNGTLTADFLITGAGPLSNAKIPDLPGLADFPGEVFHSSQWNHEYDLTGKRVAVIGTGASAIQFVPQIQPKVATLTLFQRTPPWILPRVDRALTSAEKAAFGHVPGAQRLARFGIWATRESTVPGFVLQPQLLRAGEAIARMHLRRAIKDPDLRELVTPDYRLGCKRVLLSNDYYPALGKYNVDVISAGLTSVKGNTVIGSDGSKSDVDAIIFGTGFHVTDAPIAERIVGANGVRLSTAWAGGMNALRGTTVNGFPNLFFLVGPNSGLSHSSIVFIIESQLNYVVDALKQIDRHQIATFEPRADVQERWNATLQRRMKRTVWVNGGCASWYQDEHGRVTTQWPSSTWRYRMGLKKFDPSEHRLTVTAEAPSMAVTR